MSQPCIPMSSPDLTAAEIEAVTQVLQTRHLSIGPRIAEFEERFAAYVGARHAVAVSSGTAGLHLCVIAAGLGEGDPSGSSSSELALSTDKAVNPVNIMGASKRVAELLVQEAAQRKGRVFVAVRFGNVLGSRGSVVPLFREQIARGGPVTVTDPEMRRYFMTIPEAVQLVIQAAALGQGGEIFVLDMGEPLRIVDLARDLIELSGLQVGQDIEITFIGRRPGEKLCEELFVAGEEYDTTMHEKIFVARNNHPVDGPALYAAVAELERLAKEMDRAAIVAKLQEIVPEFRPEG